MDGEGYQAFSIAVGRERRAAGISARQRFISPAAAPEDGVLSAACLFVGRFFASMFLATLAASANGAALCSGSRRRSMLYRLWPSAKPSYIRRKPYLAPWNK